MINKNVLRFILGLKIKKLRMDQDLSLKNLSEMSGLSISYLNEIEKGKKYPSIEKLSGLASALNTNLESLVSVKTGRNLHPLLKFLESDLVKKLPLDLFGLSETDMIDMMASSPEKFANFVVTVLEVSRSYDMKVEDLYHAALRAFIESHDNYFQEIENISRTFSKEHSLSPIPTTEELENILTERYKYRIDRERLNQNELTETVNRHVKLEGSSRTLYLNSRLRNEQAKYYLGKEIGRHLNGDVTKSSYDFVSLIDYIKDYKAAYFSGALLLEEKSLAESLQAFFTSNKFDGDQLLSIIEKYKVSSETFFHRLTQILPHHFQLKKLFMLRSDSKLHSDEYFISKELHLGGLHSPHGVRIGEHYCRRWITIDLIKRYKQTYHENSANKLVGAQISIMHNGSQYLCISIARPSQTKPDTLSCFTIGIKIDEGSSKVIRFLKDPSILTTRVGQTCERCSIQDCTQRVAPAKIYLNEKLKEDCKAVLDQL